MVAKPVSSFRASTSHNENEDQNHSDIPVWDGAPQGRSCCEKYVQLRALGTNWDVTFCLAARLVACFRGASRRAAMAIPHQDLMHIRGIGEEPSELKNCIKRVLSFLDEKLGPDKSVRRPTPPWRARHRLHESFRRWRFLRRGEPFACLVLPTEAQLDRRVPRTSRRRFAGLGLQARAVDKHGGQHVPRTPQKIELRHSDHGRPHAAAHHGGRCTGKKCGGKSRDATAAEIESDELEDVRPEADHQGDIALDDLQDVAREATGRRRSPRGRRPPPSAGSRSA